MRHTFLPALFAILLPAIAQCDDGLIAHWPLAGNAQDVSGNRLHATSHGVDFAAAGPSGARKTAAAFDGRGSLLEIPTHERLRLGGKDFSVSMWVQVDSGFDDVPGDLISQYDAVAHRGFHLGMKTNAGVTFSQPNARHLQFGIDQDRPTPDVRYRRAWTMAEHDGAVFCSTLPSGKVYSWRAGRVAMAGIAFPFGWHHVAAVRSAGSLNLFVDGTQVATRTGFNAADYDLTCDQPLQIGFGPNDYFKGKLSDVKLYGRALSESEIRSHAKKK